MLTQRTVRAIELLSIIEIGGTSLSDSAMDGTSVEDSLLLNALERGGFIAPLSFVDSTDYRLLSPLSEISLLGLLHAVGEGCDPIEVNEVNVIESRSTVGALALHACGNTLRRLLFEIKINQL